MEIMEESHIETGQKKSRNGLIIALIVLGVVIVGLIVAIVVLRLPGVGGGQGVGGNTEVECSDLDNVEDIELCIEGKVDENASVDEWVGYYQDAIDSAMEDDDSVLAAGLLISKLDYLVRWGECDTAMKELDDLDKTLYTEGMLIELYYNGIYYANSCGDVEASQRFTAIYDSLVNGEQNA